MRLFVSHKNNYMYKYSHTCTYTQVDCVQVFVSLRGSSSFGTLIFGRGGR